MKGEGIRKVSKFDRNFLVFAPCRLHHCVTYRIRSFLIFYSMVGLFLYAFARMQTSIKMPTQTLDSEKRLQHNTLVPHGEYPRNDAFS